MKAAIGLFKTYEKANEAIDKLHEAGLTSDQISVVAPESVLESVHTDNVEGEDLSQGAGAGAVVGGLLGLIAGIGAITIPGIGPVITAGAIATALGSTAVGAGLGGLVGALVDLGIPDEEAEVYIEGIKRGEILISVTGSEEDTQQAQRIFTAEGANNIQTLTTNLKTEPEENHSAP